MLLKDDYKSSNKVNYILQMLRWETRLVDITLNIRILLRIIKSATLLPQADSHRKLPAGDSLPSDKLSPSLRYCINGVMQKCNLLVTLKFPDDISTSELIDVLTSHFLRFQVYISTRLDLQYSGFRQSWILRR